MASTADLISADTLVSDRPTMGARPLPRADAVARAGARMRPVRNVIAEALASEASDTTGAGEKSLPSATEYADIMLFVGNLAPAVSESDLVAAFAPYGDLLSCRIIRDRQRGHSLGYGFVRFTSKEDARLALDQLQGTCIMGQDISIGYARGTGPREPEEDHHVPARRPGQSQPRYDPQNRLGFNNQDTEESDDAEHRYRAASSFRSRSGLPLRRSPFRRTRSLNRYPGTSAPGRENRIDEAHDVEDEDE
ncbi:hypothetical protein F1559_003679 [Cyanidiococcus yangmingshanensis]|uniref:RRM domain-containing protein n=1 Tax=Cyanidiococcus yangmingshanensis TaxID=2690220 RepID=A0A7J7IFC1_9RHOD|nr:hypothetical protein F1559_003679 [Cyanidiococcus yangmingshanensis]